MIEETDPELYAQMQEEAATDRVRERMNLKHRSTSAFAKRCCSTHTATSPCAGHIESLALGGELKERIEAGLGAMTAMTRRGTATTIPSTIATATRWDRADSKEEEEESRRPCCQALLAANILWRWRRRRREWCRAGQVPSCLTWIMKQRRIASERAARRTCSKS